MQIHGISYVPKTPSNLLVCISSSSLSESFTQLWSASLRCHPTAPAWGVQHGTLTSWVGIKSLHVHLPRVTRTVGSSRLMKAESRWRTPNPLLHQKEALNHILLSSSPQLHGVKLLKPTYKLLYHSSLYDVPFQNCKSVYKGKQFPNAEHKASFPYFLFIRTLKK